MWANAQRDGRPAEHRWRPMFNVVKFGWRPLLDCRAVTLQRRDTLYPLKYDGGTPNPPLDHILSRYSGPKFTIL